MTIDERNEVYERLEKQNGKNHQILVAIEEMSELQKELTKYLREDSYTNSKKICEELADVKVVCEQLDRFFDPEQKLVPFTMDYKLERLKMFYLKDAYTGPIIIYNKKEYCADKMDKKAQAEMLELGGFYKD